MGKAKEFDQEGFNEQIQRMHDAGMPKDCTQQQYNDTYDRVYGRHFNWNGHMDTILPIAGLVFGALLARAFNIGPMIRYFLGF